MKDFYVFESAADGKLSIGDPSPTTTFDHVVSKSSCFISMDGYKLSWKITIY